MVLVVPPLLSSLIPGTMPFFTRLLLLVFSQFFPCIGLPAMDSDKIFLFSPLHRSLAFGP